MKKSDKQKEKREFPKDWKPIARVPKECLQDIGDIRLEFIGELMPQSNTTIPVIKNLLWLETESKDEQND
jgi:hypothetical protein